MIMRHPTPWDFHPVHHPSYIDFFEQVLAETTDPVEMHKQLRGVLRHRPVVHPPLPDRPRLPRRPPVLHVVLVRARPRAPGPGDHRRRRPRGGAPAGLRAGLHAGRRARDGQRRGRARRRRSPTCTPRRSSWPTSSEPPARCASRSRSAGCRFPLAAPDLARRRRPAGPRAPGRPRLRPRVVAPLPGPPGPGDGARQRHPAAGPPRRPDHRPRAIEHLRHVEAPVIFAANHASHLDTPLLLTTLPVAFRHRTVVAAAADYFFDRTLEGRPVVVLPGRHPDRAQPGQPALGRHRRRAARGRLEPGDLPRGRPLPRRLGPAVPGRRRLPRPADRAPGRPGYLHGTRHVLPKRAAEAPGGPGRLGHREPRAGGCGGPRSP